VFKKQQFMNKKYILILLALLGGLLMAIGWPARGIPIFLFFGFVPLLFIENHIANNRDKFHKFSVLFYSYILFFVWNILTTWWIVYASLFGAIMAVAFNALFMAVTFHFYHLSKKLIYNHKQGIFLLLIFWLGFEYLHLNWELSWTWLTLGNGFARWHQIVQWYEFTGVFGGSLWILVINIFIFKLLKLLFEKERNYKKIIVQSSIIFLLFTIPILGSLFMYNNYKEEIKPVNIVLVQPNNDPYTEQYHLPTSELVNKIIRVA